MFQFQVQNLYYILRRKHGHPAGQWSLWCKRPKTLREKEEVIIGAILTQNTNWNNVERAIENLKNARTLSLEKIHILGQKNPEKLERLIRPSGFYKAKTRYLTEVAGFFVKNGGVKRLALPQMPLTELRKSLLDLHGVGPETADSILLYALEKPVFVIDEYTRRLVKKLNWYAGQRDRKYEELRAFFEKNLRRDYKLYQDFHALVVIDGKYAKKESLVLLKKLYYSDQNISLSRKRLKIGAALAIIGHVV